MSQLKPAPDCAMLINASIDDLKEYKKNALRYLKESNQYATAKIVEELFDLEIFQRKVCEMYNNIFPEKVG